MNKLTYLRNLSIRTNQNDLSEQYEHPNKQNNLSKYSKHDNTEHTRPYEHEETEDFNIPHFLVQSELSLENNFKVQNFNSSCSNVLDDSVGYKFLIRQNEGKPPSHYSPNLEGRVQKYPNAHQVTTQRLSEPLKAFVYKLSIEHVPNTV